MRKRDAAQAIVRNTNETKYKNTKVFDFDGLFESSLRRTSAAGATDTDPTSAKDDGSGSDKSSEDEDDQTDANRFYEQGSFLGSLQASFGGGSGSAAGAKAAAKPKPKAAKIVQPSATQTQIRWRHLALRSRPTLL